MFALITYLIVTACAYVWISRDSDTEEIFVIYGPEFFAALQMKAWSAFIEVGLRLLLLTAVLISCTYLAIVAAQGLCPQNSIVPAQVVMVGVVLSLVPWIYINRRWRHEQYVKGVATRLKPIAEDLATNDLNTQYQPAGYDTTEEWDAWHPKDEHWNTKETRSIWSGIVPVLYATKAIPRQLVFPLDWKTFLVWNSPLQLQSSSCELPFTGPGNFRFTLQGQHKLKSNGEWWILRAEMILDTNEAGEIV